jgi:hypothetical protein
MIYLDSILDAGSDEIANSRRPDHKRSDRELRGAVDYGWVQVLGFPETEMSMAPVQATLFCHLTSPPAVSMSFS